MVLSRNRTQTRFVVLPPTGQIVSSNFRNVQSDGRLHNALFAEMQRFRGSVYLNDGAIQASALSDGRHKVSIDENSWHVLSVDANGRICACLRYLEEHDAQSVDDLWVKNAAVASCPTMGRRFRNAVETEMARARRMRIGFGEVGGWAVAESHRATLEPLRIILATYALLQLRGGCAGVATATFRHSSSSILRRIGLNSLFSDGAELLPYYDPAYQCQMEVLQFDSRFPNEKYRASVNELSKALAAAPVICRDEVQPSWGTQRLEIPFPEAPVAQSFAPAAA